MKKPVVLIGIGEMGAVFARGFLRLGHPVYPVTRHMDRAQEAGVIPEPEAVLVAVAENDLEAVLRELPAEWHGRLILLQNELLPADFSRFEQVTVISVWFEKKKGQDSRVIIPSPAYGPKAGLLQDALGSLDIPVRILHTPRELLFELVVKNLYILTSNIAGLKTAGTVGQLWEEHREIAQAVANDVIGLQEALTGEQLDREALIEAMLRAFEGDPDHKCMGRSAPARLERALGHAAAHNLDVPTLGEIAADMH